MLSWGAKRRLVITLSAIAVALLLIGLYVFPKVLKAPSCSDGKLNQGESGVDCGGPCVRICENQVIDLAKGMLWARAFAVTPDSYNAVAYIVNSNPHSTARNIAYVFQLYDSRNILVAERSGVADIPPQRTVPIFEGDIKTGRRVPARVEFILQSVPEWTSTRSEQPELRVRDQLMADEDVSPLLTARVQNDSENISVRNLPLVALIYDSEGNARAASRTIVDSIGPLGSEDILFSWPIGFDFQISRLEIIPLATPGVNY